MKLILNGRKLIEINSSMAVICRSSVRVLPSMAFSYFLSLKKSMHFGLGT